MRKFKKMIHLIFISLVILQLPGCQKDDGTLMKEIVLKDTSSITKPDTTKSDIAKTDSLNADTTKIYGSKLFTGNKIYVENPGTDRNIQPNILKAYYKAVDGDMLVLPAGKFSYTGELVITKLISMQGAGRDLTILYRSESTPDNDLNNKSFFTWNINRDVSSNIKISGFTLKSKKPADINNANGSMVKDYGIKIKQALDFVITNCRFENFGYAAILVSHKDDLARGLIYNNYFKHNFKGDGLGLGYGVCIIGANQKWVSSPKFGSNNFIFVENNTFEYHRHAISGAGCALYVFRYNSVNENLISHAIDMHEARGYSGGNYYSSRAAEAYNNKLINKQFDNNTPIILNQSAFRLSTVAIRLRGGESVIYNNYIEGYLRGVGLTTVLYSTFSSKYPIPYQIGYLSALKYGLTGTGYDSDKGNGDVFIWSNTFIKYNSSKDHYFLWNDKTNYIKEGLDYHNVKKPGYSPYVYPHPLTSL